MTRSVFLFLAALLAVCSINLNQAAAQAVCSRAFHFENDRGSVCTDSEKAYRRAVASLTSYKAVEDGGSTEAREHPAGPSHRAQGMPQWLAGGGNVESGRGVSTFGRPTPGQYESATTTGHVWSFDQAVRAGAQQGQVDAASQEARDARAKAEKAERDAAAAREDAASCCRASSRSTSGGTPKGEPKDGEKSKDDEDDKKAKEEPSWASVDGEFRTAPREADDKKREPDVPAYAREKKEK